MNVEELLGMTAEEFLELKNTLRVDAMLVENDRNPPAERPTPLPFFRQIDWEQARLEDLW